MKTISSIPSNICKDLNILFCDIDDTVTLDGVLIKESFQSLWDAHDAGISIIPITGRPAGWVDQIARIWPVKAVIGENGGLYFWMQEGRLERRYVQNEAKRKENRSKLSVIREQIMKEIPQAGIASDQPYREFDLAIDFCEDVAPLPAHDVKRIAEIFKEHGAQAKISSIHVNGWFGSFDKLTTCLEVGKHVLKCDEKDLLETSIFIGDSLNDEPMFSWFKHTVGVANIKRFLPDMEHTPEYLTEEEGGRGFAQLVAHILTNRTGS